MKKRSDTKCFGPFSRIPAALACIALVFAVPAARGIAAAQDALKDRVDQLIERLGSQDSAAADAAAQALIKLGPRVLPLLPASGAQGANEAVARRLGEVRSSLESSGNRSPSASRVTLQGEAMRLSDVMKALQQQTGNTLIDLREQSGQTATNPSVKLDFNDTPFFKALDEITAKAGLSLNFYNAEGAIAYLQADESMPAEGSKPASRPFVEYVDAFRVSLNQILISRDFANGDSVANMRMEFVWEPRLRPLSMKLETGKIKAVDDKGRPIAASVAGESMELAIRPENPIVDVNLNLTAPPRDAERIASIELEAELTVPTRTVRLTLPDITRKDSLAESGNSRLKIVDFENEPPVWKIRAELSAARPAGAENVESYQQTNLAPTVGLAKADSARIPLNGGFSVGPGSSAGSLVYELLFVDITGRPEDHGLVLEIPGELKKIPVRWSFREIPLP